MKLSPILSLNAILWMALGLIFAIYAPAMLGFFGAADIPAGNPLMYWYIVSFARLFGAALFGWGLLLFAVRDFAAETTNAAFKRGLVFALLLGNLLSAVVAITQQMQTWDTPAGWALVGVCVLLTGAYIYFLVKAE
jgi:uncharacterized membrane protein